MELAGTAAFSRRRRFDATPETTEPGSGPVGARNIVSEHPAVSNSEPTQPSSLVQQSPRSAINEKRPSPVGPVFGWASLSSHFASPTPGIDGLPHRAFTSSGRAAIYQALRLLRLPSGSGVLSPTYHCPTMIAPIVQAGLRPIFYAIDADGMPELAGIARTEGVLPRAMLVAHYFGIPRSFAAVRTFCDRHGIVLIEDCAHCLFGGTAERPVGSWGDFAIASLTKFFPVPELGLLASAVRAVPSLSLERAGLVAQIKGIADIVERACEFRRLPGLNAPLRAVFSLKRALRRGRAKSSPTVESTNDPLGGCDMSRVRQAPLLVATLLAEKLPRERIVARRRENFDCYARLLDGIVGVRPLVARSEGLVAPYVFPLWVDEPDRIYQALRSRGAAVLRWDRLWQGTPVLDGDCGVKWGRHVLQLLCHQDLELTDIEQTVAVIRMLLSERSSDTVEVEAF
jgi:perosamine synthetase